MRRIIGGSAAFLVLTGTLLVLPVYAAPVPAAEAVEPSITEVELGTFDDPAEAAVVTTDGAVVAAGDEAGVQPGDVVAPEETPAPETAPTEDPAADVPVAVSGDEVAGAPALSVSEPATADFSAVGVTWTHDPAVTSVVARVRVQGVDGAWGDWTVLEQDDIEQTGTPVDDAELRDGTAPYFTGPATGVEVVVQAADGSVPADVRTQLIDPGTSAADSTLDAVGPQDQAEAAGSMPAVFSRAQWGADEGIRSWDPEYAATIKAATIHHTADSNDYTADQVPAMMRSIYAFHTLSRGWGDIGYNVIVDKFGRMWEGRYGGLASTVIGAHAGGFNTGTFGVSMLGNYDTAQTPPAMINSVAEIVAWKFGLYNVDPNGSTQLTSGGGGTAKYSAGTVVTLPTIFGHRDVGNTSCPGRYGYAQLGAIRAMVAARVPDYQNPTGSLDAVTGGEGQVTVAGWAVDPDRPRDVVAVHVYVDGVFGTATGAGLYRGDVAALFTGAGPSHGYDVVLPLAPGSHQVCAYAINGGGGSVNTQLGCKQATVVSISHEPKGALESVSVLGHTLTYTGWALDRDAGTAPIGVHVYLDGALVSALPADGRRDDIGGQFPTAGSMHGFRGTVTSTPGQHTLCVFGINQGAGSINTSLGCSTVVLGGVEALDPFGSLDAASVTRGQLVVQGWAVDPDRATSVTAVHVYVDGAFFGATGAAAYRGDVGSLYPAAGPFHGYAVSGALDEGGHTVCAFAINAGGGTGNRSLGCTTVDVPVGTWLPTGSLDAASASGRSVVVAGWTFDPDVPTAAVGVHVYVDGRFATSTSAGLYRGDIAAAYPGVGATHGYHVTVPVTAGAHQVCVFAINQGRGAVNPSLGCKAVTTQVAAYTPRGSLDAVSRTGNTVSVAGWAFDPDSSSPIAVHVYVDDKPEVALVADRWRADVAAAVPGAGPISGYTGQVTVSAGPHTVCVYAINVNDGAGNPGLGCRSVTS